MGKLAIIIVSLVVLVVIVNDFLNDLAMALDDVL